MSKNRKTNSFTNRRQYRRIIGYKFKPSQVNSNKPESTKALEAKWEARLSAEGLAAVLPSGNPYRSGSVSHDHTTWQAKTEYFQALGRHMADKAFKSKEDWVIMQMRSQGRSFHDTKQVLDIMGFLVPDKTIRYTVRSYEQRWGLRKWTKKQLGMYDK